MSKTSRGQPTPGTPIRGNEPVQPSKGSSSGSRLTYYALLGVIVSAAVAFSSGYHEQFFANGSKGTYAICSQSEPAIYTVDSDNSKVHCLLVRANTILSTGTLDQVTLTARESGPLTPGAQLTVKYIPNDAIIVPGISDSHGHMLEYGANRILPLDGCKSIQDTVERVKRFISTHPLYFNDSSRIVEGWGWDHTSWPAEVFPTAADFEADPLTRGRAIVLRSKDGHALWVSPTVLSSIESVPKIIDGGVVVRDTSGNPTGVFLDNAQELIKRPPLTDDDLRLRFETTVRDALSKGMTSIHDAGFEPTSLAFYERQAKKGNLPIRVYGMSYYDESAEYWGQTRRKILNEGRLTARSVKIFADGALRSGGAALHEPYSDNPHTKGFMRPSLDILRVVIPRYLRDGWQVNVHAIGDRANQIVLDIFEDALKGVNVTALRPRIEHAQIVTEKDMERLGKLGIIASVQPTHAVSDMWYAEDRLGPERVKNLYAFRSMVDHGARITFGSDFPVEDMNPIAGFYAAVTRLSPDGGSPHGPGGWFPEQRLTRLEALRGMTIDPAFASFSESRLGSLETGKIADYVVLSQDIMKVQEDKILETKVLATVIDGQAVYGQI